MMPAKGRRFRSLDDGIMWTVRVVTPEAVFLRSALDEYAAIALADWPVPWLVPA